MNQKKVCVLLSAYNGEKYIREQIDSILNQTYENIILHVRDDGSSDSTPDILGEYERDGRLVLTRGENTGFIKSFLSLVENTEDADYYAFADQDDIWLPEKIENAVRYLDGTDSSVPQLYFCNHDCYDGDMNFECHSPVIKYNLSFLNSVVDCAPLGFCTVFNRAAAESVRKYPPEKSCGHDWWMYMICAAFGEVHYDGDVYVKYRKHGNNVSFGKSQGFISFQIWRFRKFFKNNYFADVREQIKEFHGYHYSRLSDENRAVMDLFVPEKPGFKARMRKVFCRSKMRSKGIDEFFLRIVFLLGKL